MKTPKEIKEFLNNKVLANISGNTPKVETISIDDFIEWFESGVLIPYEFYYSQDGKYSWVIQFKGFREKEFDPVCYYYMLKIHDNTLNYDFSCVNNGWITATPAQKQQLTDKVQEETGKVWNEQTKSFEDKPKEILVPENIKIVKGCDGKLGLLFNERKQVITSFNVDESVKYTDLANITDQRHYVMKVTDENGVSIQDEGCSIRIHGIDTGAVVYKVIPIK